MLLPKSLEFLLPHMRNYVERLKKAPWLRSNFENEIWEYNFCFKKNMRLCWGVELHDGSNLLDEKHEALLTTFKHWLIAATQNEGGNIHTTTLPSQYNKFNATLHCIDYLLLNSASIELLECGIAGLSEANIRTMIDTIGSSNQIAEGLYGWSKRLSEFCLKLLDETPKDIIDVVLNDHPYLTVVTDEQREANSLPIPLGLVPSIRACLYLRKYYSYNPRKGYNVNSKKINKCVYSNILSGALSQKPIHGILSYSLSNEVYSRECPGVPVRTAQHVRMSRVQLRKYQLSIYSLKKLSKVGLKLPPLEVLGCALESTVEGGEQGRYRSVPADVIFTSFKNAVTFHRSFGCELVSSYCRLAIFCKKNNKRHTELTEEEVLRCLDESLVNAGVNRLGLSCLPKESTLGANEARSDNVSYFVKLRSNSGLLEMLVIYYGAIQIVVGLLMARRCSELLDLSSIACLDETKTWLYLWNRKGSRGVGATKQLIARPIDPLAVEMISQLIRLHKILRRIGFGDSSYSLFSTPALKGTATLISTDVEMYYRNIDLFQDYYESRLDGFGNRYYIRQHQMRRFFALLFFQCSTSGDAETLRWMLGHTDFQHLYNYITETVPGSELRGSKADFMCENLNSYSELSQLLENRYGTQVFNVSEKEKVTSYLEDLLEAGDVEMEPDFFEDHKGKQMRIVVLVKSK
jgi:hypothetical protein